MDVKLSEIREKFPELIARQLGADVRIRGLAPAEDCGPGDLVFLENKNFAEKALAGKPSAAVIAPALVPQFENQDEISLLVSSNVKLAHALIKQAYAGRDFSEDGPRVHPSAAIHPSVKVPESSYVGPNASIGEGASIGERCRILAGAVVEKGARIGNDTILHPNCVIGYDCVVGSFVEVGAGSVIGSEGFGFAQDQKGKSHKLPQTGVVVLEDHVRLGANNCIDRATYGETRVGKGTKTDNLCHIAHNVRIGGDCLLTAMLCVAGSTEIGNRVMTSGQTGILDHMKVASDVVLLHRAGVTKDITEPGMYAGLPTQPLGDYMKNLAQQRQIGKLGEKIKALEEAMKRMQERDENV